MAGVGVHLTLVYEQQNFNYLWIDLGTVTTQSDGTFSYVEDNFHFEDLQLDGCKGCPPPQQG